MKILPTSLLALTLTLSLSLAQAEDSPKGQGRGPMQQMILQKFDANKNGTLDPEEKAAAMKAMQERKAGAPGTKGDPAKGDGPMQAMLLQKFDANKNGTLDPEEKAAAMKAMQERRGKSTGIPGTTPPTSEGGSKFRRPPEAPKEGTAK